MVELDVISWLWIAGYFAIAIAFLLWMLTSLGMWKDIFPKVEVAKPNKKIFNWKA